MGVTIVVVVQTKKEYSAALAVLKKYVRQINFRDLEF
jgi:hypothetical protein